MLHVIDELGNIQGKKLIMADFNEDILMSSTIGTLMELHGYSQHPTTEKGTLIFQDSPQQAQNSWYLVIRRWYLVKFWLRRRVTKIQCKSNV